MEKPQWWSKVEDLSWDKVKGSLTDEWQKVAGGAQKLEHKLAENAIAFGHGAKSAYNQTAQKMDGWSDEVEKRLKADWEKTHKDASVTWDKVRDAVKHGWERTKKG